MSSGCSFSAPSSASRTPSRGSSLAAEVYQNWKFSLGLEKSLYLGNLDALRDWGHAKDYVEMQWRMLQQEKPEDYVIATGRMESVRKFLEISAEKIGWNKDSSKPPIIWEGEGINEIGIRPDTGEAVIKVDARYFRPTEVEQLLGDPQKALDKLGWKPSTNLEELIDEMINHDKKLAAKESLLMQQGFQPFI